MIVVVVHTNNKQRARQQTIHTLKQTTATFNHQPSSSHPFIHPSIHPSESKQTVSQDFFFFCSFLLSYFLCFLVFIYVFSFFFSIFCFQVKTHWMLLCSFPHWNFMFSYVTDTDIISCVCCTLMKVSSHNITLTYPLSSLPSMQSLSSLWHREFNVLNKHIDRKQFQTPALICATQCVLPSIHPPPTHSR